MAYEPTEYASSYAKTLLQWNDKFQRSKIGKGFDDRFKRMKYN